MGTQSPVNMNSPKPKPPAPNLLADAASLVAAADQAIAACGGDAREAVKALLIANEFLKREMEAQVSRGHTAAARSSFAAPRNFNMR